MREGDFISPYSTCQRFLGLCTGILCQSTINEITEKPEMLNLTENMKAIGPVKT